MHLPTADSVQSIFYDFPMKLRALCDDDNINYKNIKIKTIQFLHRMKKFFNKIVFDEVDMQSFAMQNTIHGTELVYMALVVFQFQKLNR